MAKQGQKKSILYITPFVSVKVFPVGCVTLISKKSKRNGHNT